jgi:hypothetical protein
MGKVPYKFVIIDYWDTNYYLPTFLGIKIGKKYWRLKAGYTESKTKELVFEDVTEDIQRIDITVVTDKDAKKIKEILHSYVDYKGFSTNIRIIKKVIDANIGVFNDPFALIDEWEGYYPTVHVPYKVHVSR